MKVTELPSAAYLDLGKDLHGLANELIKKYEIANGAPLNRDAADKIVDLVFENPGEADKAKAEVLRGHLYAVLKRQGEPTSAPAQELLEAAADQKRQNEATGLRTQELILAREWAMLILRGDRNMTPDEYVIWQEARHNKTDQVGMLPAASQSKVYREAANIVDRGGS